MKNMRNMKNMKILIQGGGPVGLFMALALSNSNPNHKIHVVEKRARYSRRQVLLLQPDVVQILERELPPVKVATCNVKPPPINRGVCFKKKTKSGMKSVATKDFEYALKKECERRKNVMVLNEARPYSDYDILIASDGSKSDLGKLAGIGSTKVNKSKEANAYGLAVILALKGVKSGPDKENLSTPQHRMRAFKIPGRKSMYYVGVNLSKDEYDSMMGANSTKRKKIVKNLLDEEASPFYGLGVTEIEQYYLFEIQPHKRNRVAIKKSRVGGGKPLFFVGDAALSHHFFSGQGVNAGIRQAIALGQGLSVSVDHAAKKLTDVVNKQSIEVENRSKVLHMNMINLKPRDLNKLSSIQRINALEMSNIDIETLVKMFKHTLHN